MASVRHVLNNIGRRAKIVRGQAVVAEVLASVRGSLALIEPKAEPLPGDILELPSGRYWVQSVAAELHEERLDHYRLDVVAVGGGSSVADS